MKYLDLPSKLTDCITHWCLTPPWSNDNQLKLIILKSDEKA